MRPYPEGIACAWLASDRQGHVGVFITAGAGPIPEASLYAGRLDIVDVEAQLCRLPPVSQARLLVSVKSPDDFIDLAERGLFVYDWTDIYRTLRGALNVYEPAATPSQPIAASSLLSDLLALANAVQLTEVVFATGDFVDIRAHVKCVEMDRWAKA